MGWIEARIKSLEFSIKLTKKAMVAQISLMIVNISGCAWNAYWIHNSYTDLAWFGFGIGAFTSNLLWTLFFIFRYWEEISSDKTELRYLNQLEDKEYINEDMKYYRDARKVYEDAYVDLIKKNRKILPQGNSCG